jgi:plasmid maintenance system antidote protein VapI
VRELILAQMGASTVDFAHAVGVSQHFAECFFAGDQDVDIDLVHRLSPLCRTSQALWLELQLNHRLNSLTGFQPAQQSRIQR